MIEEQILNGASVNMSEDTGQQQKTIHLVPGLSVWGGTINEEYLPALKPWSRAVKIYKGMQDDAVVGALLESIQTPLMSSEFEVIAAGDTAEDKRAKKFVEDNMHTMPKLTWREHVQDMIEFLDFGWAIAEKTLEKRADGRLYLRSLTPIGQETLFQWGKFDKYGDVESFMQRDPDGKIREVKMDKLVHFVWKGRKKDPMGKSLLRGIYRPYYFKNNLEALEAIGAERDVGNAPVATLGEGHYTDAQITALKAALAGFRLDEAMYVILPNGIELAAYGGGNKVYDVRTIIRDYQHLIRQRFFASFLSMGSSERGTQALARELTTFFGEALRSIQIAMTETWNADLVPYLFKWNRWEPANGIPKIEWIRPGRRSVQMFAQALSTFVGADVLTTDDEIEDHIRKDLGLPPRTVDSLREEKIEAERAMIKRQKEDAEAPPQDLTKPAGSATADEDDGKDAPPAGQSPPAETPTGRDPTTSKNSEFVSPEDVRQWVPNAIKEIIELWDKGDIARDEAGEALEKAGMLPHVVSAALAGGFRWLVRSGQAGNETMVKQQHDRRLSDLERQRSAEATRAKRGLSARTVRRKNLRRKFEFGLARKVKNFITGRKQLQSTNVNAVRYNEDDLTMDVTFLNGSTYRYEGVDGETYESMLDSASPGKFVWETLRNNGADNTYPFTKL